MVVHVHCIAPHNIAFPRMTMPPKWMLSPGALAATAVIASTLLQQGSFVVDGARIKIHLAADIDRDSGLGHRLRPRQAPQSACSDKQVQDGSGLPPEILNNRDFNRTKVRFYSSATAKEYINANVFTRTVSGLPIDQTVRDVFSTLLSENCYPFSLVV